MIPTGMVSGDPCHIRGDVSEHQPAWLNRRKVMFCGGTEVEYLHHSSKSKRVWIRYKGKRYQISPANLTS